MQPRVQHQSDGAFRRCAIAAATAIGIGLVAQPAAALSWQAGDLNLQLDTRVSAGELMRVQGPDPIYIGIANGGKAYSNNIDDGEFAFGHANLAVYQTDLITSALTVTYHDYGVFARANYTYDPLLKDKNFFRPSSFGPGHEYGPAVLAAKNQAVRDHIASDGTVLDLYAFGNFDLAGHSLSVKVGKQIVNWGESTFVLNGLNSIVPIDADKARVPGAEISDFVVPVPQVFASLSLTNDVSVEGWYQWKWYPTLIGSAGNYFPIPDQDFVGNGGNAGDLSFGLAPEYSQAGAPCYSPNDPAICAQYNASGHVSPVPFGGSVPRAPDRVPGNSPEFGGAARFFVSALNDTEIDLYAARYHSRLPVFSGISAASGNIDSTTARYFAEYPEDIQMYGLSFNASLPWGIGFQGEYSYKPNQPLQLNAVEVELTQLGSPSQLSPVPGAALGNQYIRGWRRKKVSQLDFGFTKLFGPSSWLGWDQVLVIGEIAGDRVHDLERPNQLRYEGPATFLPGNPQTAKLLGVPVQASSAYPTANSWGYKLLARATYHDVLPGVTLEPGLRWDHDVAGITPLPLGNFVRNSRTITATIGWRYLNNLTGEFGYTTYFGGGQNNLFRDRDYLETFVRYSF